MAADFTDEFFRDAYKGEIDHKSKLDSGDNLLVAVLLALAGLGTYYLKILPVGQEDTASQCFLFFSSLFAIAFAVAIIAVIASIWPRDYALLSSPRACDGYVRGLEEFHAHYHDKEDEKAQNRVARDLAKLLRQQYVDAGECTRQHNVRKTDCQAVARRAIGAAVILTLANAIPCYFVQRSKTEIQRVELVSFVTKEELNVPAKAPATPNVERIKAGTSKAGTASDSRAEGRHAPQQAQQVKPKGGK